jgi:hypothetical protein
MRRPSVRKWAFTFVQTLAARFYPDEVWVLRQPEEATRAIILPIKASTW